MYYIIKLYSKICMVLSD